MYVSSARVAHLYYVESLTQQQIADRLGISRIRVSRLLQQARDDGVVRISIRYDGYFRDLEAELTGTFGVRAVVADSLDGADEQRVTAVAAAGAEYLTTVLVPGSTLAVGWGATMRRLADELAPGESGVAVVPLIGGQGRTELGLHATTIADRIAGRSGGTAEALLAPAIARSAGERDAFLGNPDVRRVLAAAAAAPVAVFSVGAPFAPEATLRQSGYIDTEDIETLRAADARCDVVSLCYLDGAGRDCAVDLARRAVSITADELRAIPTKVLVAATDAKAEAIRLALRAGYVDTLVTDDRTARAVLAGA